ncbi:unnamed protein product, partial [Symbiodinium sp. KB8]
MAFFPRLCMMLSLTAAAAAQTFSTTPGQLEAKVTLQTNSSWHLGGFCLGQAGPEMTKAAEIQAHVEWEGQQQLSQTGPVMLAAFDAREDRWGAVKDAWGQMTCEEKLSAASMQRHLGKNHSYSDFTFRINVHQTSAIRDWHFAVLTCGETEQAVLTLRLVATNGVLNMFEANTHFDTNSCPVAPWTALMRAMWGCCFEVDVPWLSAAHDEARQAASELAASIKAGEDITFAWP